MEDELRKLQSEVAALAGRVGNLENGKFVIKEEMELYRWATRGLVALFGITAGAIILRTLLG